MKTINRIFILLILFVFFSFLEGAVPNTINYQGKLTDPDGIALEGFTGIKFTIFDSLTGGSALWSDSLVVDVSNGLFDVVLGPISLDFNQPYWIELKVESETLTPRQPFTSVPYSLNSKASLFSDSTGAVDWTDISNRPSGLDSTEFIWNQPVNNSFIVGQDASFDITGSAEIGGGLEVSGNVGIGTINPVAPLQVEFNSSSTMDISNNSSVYIWNTNSTDNNQAAIVFCSNPGTRHAALQCKFTDHTLSSVNADLYLWTVNDNTLNQSMVIKDDGDVGIGTVTPSARLEVTRDYGSSNGTVLDVNASGGSGIESPEIFGINTDVNMTSNGTGRGIYSRVHSTTVAINAAGVWGAAVSTSPSSNLKGVVGQIEGGSTPNAAAAVYGVIGDITVPFNGPWAAYFVGPQYNTEYICLNDITPPDPDNRLYASGGDLYWDGTLLNGASGGLWTDYGTYIYANNNNASPTAACGVRIYDSGDAQPTALYSYKLGSAHKRGIYAFAGSNATTGSYRNLGILAEATGGGTGSDDGNAYGVVGFAQSNTSYDAVGVYGEVGTAFSYSTLNVSGIKAAVYGNGGSIGYGIYGNGKPYGVYGTSPTDYGGYFEAPTGMYARDNATTAAMYGGYGGFGCWGISASSTNLAGVHGELQSYAETYGEMGTYRESQRCGVYGHQGTGNYAGYFNGNLYVTGKFTALGGIDPTYVSFTPQTGEPMSADGVSDPGIWVRNTDDHLIFTNGTGDHDLSGFVSSTGSDKYIPRFNGSYTLENSAIYEDDDGDIGVGITSPSYKLDVEGQVRAMQSGGGNATPLMLSNGDRSWNFRVVGGIGDCFDLYTSGYNYCFNIYPQETGKVGIGKYASYSDAKLHVNSLTSGGPDNVLIVSKGDAVTPDTSLLIVKRSGNVGIGTDSPTALLDVRGTAVFNEDGADNDFRIECSTNPYLFNVDTDRRTVVVGEQWGVIDISGTEDILLKVAGDVKVGGGMGATTGNSEFIKFDSYTQWYMGIRNEGSHDETDFFISHTEVEDGTFQVEYDGDIGIGTTVPAHKLDVNGDARTRNLYPYGDAAYDFGSTSNRWDEGFFDGPLYVTDYSSQGVKITNNEVYQYYDGQDLIVGAGKDLIFSSWISGWSENMRILENGNVGIGIPDPDYQLHSVINDDSESSGAIVGQNLSTEESSGQAEGKLGTLYYGVYAENEITWDDRTEAQLAGGINGVYGYKNDNDNNAIMRGVFGQAIGTWAANDECYGVYGSASGGDAANFGVYYSGGLGGSGSKLAIVRTEEGPRGVYCQESPENWFEDFGSAVIENGSSIVRIKKDYLQTVTIDHEHPMKVFITPNQRIGEWWVEKDEAHFILHAPDAPDGAEFDYRVAAKRRDFEDVRLELIPGAYTDHYLYPDIRDVPQEHRLSWIKLLNDGDWDPEWLQFLTEEQKILINQK
ncbi:hypothetical protein JXI42_13095 [bacterium]|nr:hypothetical protein [bacterium]